MASIVQEKKIVSLMIGIYCRKHHGEGDLCAECRELERYAHRRLDRCCRADVKTSCRRCPVHCYKPAMRQAICEVMRYSGPRMLWHHPIEAIKHLLD